MDSHVSIKPSLLMRAQLAEIHIALRVYGYIDDLAEKTIPDRSAHRHHSIV